MKASLNAPGAKRRNAELGKIHLLARKQLRLDEETYRALLERVTGKRSAGDLDDRGRHAVIAELQRLTGEGGRVMRNATPFPDAPTNVKAEIRAMVGKVGALLADAKRQWAYAHGLAQKMFKVQRVEWLRADQLHRLVAAMSIDQNRRDARTVAKISGETAP